MMVERDGLRPEQNPLVHVLGPAAVPLKIALVVFIAVIAPHLGQYRRLVLGAAIVAGLLGAYSNFRSAG